MDVVTFLCPLLYVWCHQILFCANDCYKSSSNYGTFYLYMYNKSLYYAFRLVTMVTYTHHVYYLYCCSDLLIKVHCLWNLI